MEHRKSTLTVEQKVCNIMDTYIPDVWIYMDECPDLTPETIGKISVGHCPTREVRCTDGTVWYNPKFMYAYAKMNGEDEIRYTDYYNLNDADEEEEEE